MRCTCLSSPRRRTGQRDRTLDRTELPDRRRPPRSAADHQRIKWAFKERRVPSPHRRHHQWHGIVWNVIWKPLGHIGPEVSLLEKSSKELLYRAPKLYHWHNDLVAKINTKFVESEEEFKPPKQSYCLQLSASSVTHPSLNPTCWAPVASVCKRSNAYCPNKISRPCHVQHMSQNVNTLCCDVGVDCVS